ncbi:hypothetical protein QBC34DRAFT_43032 [Podospora aff. communis PSN243]|uniref:Uncharacterized protein n=1 Tax=Podospora aff. communis PSN243 TaxID=3040156 RepID=A0AAV9GX94_9PEZI|nr:hypothetical protein QBC34DRAFT_43032 [Podospora aff. communis PSN243]
MLCSPVLRTRPDDDVHGCSIMTAIGPLTTTFRAPSSCTATPQIYQIFTGNEYRLEQGPLFTSGSNCFPPGYDAGPDRYYSPGFCPQGYTAACTKTDSRQTRSPTETALICCPTALRYTCPGVTEPASLGCTTTWKGAVAVIGVTVITDSTVSGSKIISESNGGIGVHSIQVRFKDGDASQTSVPPQGASRTLSLPTQTPTNTPAPATRGGLTTGAAIGIGVGSVVGLLLIAGTVFLCIWLRWRKMKKGRRVAPPRPPPKDPTRASTYTNGVVPSVVELSEDISRNSIRSPRLDISKRDLIGRGRTPTIATARTSRTVMSEELEDTGIPYGFKIGDGGGVGYLHPMAAELDSNPKFAAELEAPSEFEPSIRSVSQRRENPKKRERSKSGSRNRQSTPESVVSSSSWAVMRKDAVVATPWL